MNLDPFLTSIRNLEQRDNKSSSRERKVKAKKFKSLVRTPPRESPRREAPKIDLSGMIKNKMSNFIEKTTKENPVVRKLPDNAIGRLVDCAVIDMV